jgi:putative ubiquitin-RnfH superfamily antitoxin RatB of RatAB toxin-antitoxin module
MKKEKVVKAHTRKTKSGKTVQVRQHVAKYDASDMAKEALKNKKGAGMEIASKKGGVFNKDLHLDNMLKDPAAVELFKAWDAMDSGLYNEQETGKPFKGYKKAENSLNRQKKKLDAKYGKGAGDYLENNITDYVTFKKGGKAVFNPKGSK